MCKKSGSYLLHSGVKESDYLVSCSSSDLSKSTPSYFFAGWLCEGALGETLCGAGIGAIGPAGPTSAAKPKSFHCPFTAAKYISNLI